MLERRAPIKVCSVVVGPGARAPAAPRGLRALRSRRGSAAGASSGAGGARRRAPSPGASPAFSHGPHATRSARGPRPGFAARLRPIDADSRLRSRLGRGSPREALAWIPGLSRESHGRPSGLHGRSPALATAIGSLRTLPGSWSRRRARTTTIHRLRALHPIAAFEPGSALGSRASGFDALRHLSLASEGPRSVRELSRASRPVGGIVRESCPAGLARRGAGKGRSR